MDDPEWEIAKTEAPMTIDGRDFARLIFDEQTVDEDFLTYGNTPSTGYKIAYINYIIDNLKGGTLDLISNRNTSVDTKTDFSYTFRYLKVIQELMKLGEYGGYEWLATHDQDGNRKFIVRPPKELIVANVAHAFIVGDKSNYPDLPATATVHLVSGLKVNRQNGYKKNYFRVDGDGVSSVWPTTPPAIPKHLRHEDKGITSSGDAQDVAIRLSNEKSGPKILVDFSGVGVETLRVGDVVYVNDWRYGASLLPAPHLFRIIEITHTFAQSSGWTANFGVADFTPNIFDILNDTDGL